MGNALPYNANAQIIRSNRIKRKAKPIREAASGPNMAEKDMVGDDGLEPPTLSV